MGVVDMCHDIVVCHVVPRIHVSSCHIKHTYYGRNHRYLVHGDGGGGMADTRHRSAGCMLGHVICNIRGIYLRMYDDVVCVTNSSMRLS